MPKTTGETLRALRRRAGLTLAEAGRLLRPALSPARLSRYETDLRTVDARTYLALEARLSDIIEKGHNNGARPGRRGPYKPRAKRDDQHA